MVLVMQGQERLTFIAISAVIIVLTMMWAAGPTMVAELRGVKTRLSTVNLHMPRGWHKRPVAYVRRYGYRGEHRA